MEIELKVGKKYKICSCGISQTLPYCDNGHREFNAVNNTKYKSVKITPHSDTRIEVTSKCWNLDKEE